MVTNRQPYLLSLRKLPRNHLLAEVTQSYVESQLKRQVTYMPQVNDIVCYFWQGHEAYTYQYNCHHYAGQVESVSFDQFMPWLADRSI